MPVIKDLVPDLTDAYKQLTSIKPWLQTENKPNEGSERHQSPKKEKSLMDFGNVFFVFLVLHHVRLIGGMVISI